MRLLTSLGALSLALLPALAAPQLGIEVTKAAECTRKTEVGDKISVHYRGTLLADGTEFDSSYNRGKPFEFTLGQGQVIEGWDKGLLGMCIGEGRKLTIPPAMGYGNQQNGPIPAGSTLIFETELLGIAGVEAPQVPPSRPTIVKPIPAQSSEKAEEKPTPTPAPPSTPEPTPEPSEDGPAEVSSIVEVPASSTVPATAKPTAATQDSPLETEDDGECHLLGDFALIVQGALGLLAVSSLVYKRWRESPRRPLKIWFFDVSKQVFGSVLLHMANILMSMLSSGDLEAKIKAAAKAGDDSGEKPNPCSFYLLNLAIDTTIGIPILVLLLKVLHAAFLRTPLANPPESIRSGNYGHPPRATWWLKQSIIYFLGLFGMKLCVFFLFKLLPWIAWVGDWALRWTEGNEAIQITFVMFIFPLIMNALQYWIIDGFIKETPQGDGHYGAVAGEESDDEGDDEWLERHRRSRHSGEEDSDVEDGDPLKEANPTPVPIRTDYDPETDGTHGSSSSEGERLNKGGKERRL